MMTSGEAIMLYGFAFQSAIQAFPTIPPQAIAL